MATTTFNKNAQFASVKKKDNNYGFQKFAETGQKMSNWPNNKVNYSVRGKKPFFNKKPRFFNKPQGFKKNWDFKKKNFCYWWLKAYRKRKNFYKFWCTLTKKRYVVMKPYSAQYRRFSLYRTYAQKNLFFPYRARFFNLSSMPKYVNYRQLFHNQIYEKQTFRKLWRFTHTDLVRHFRKAIKHRKRLFDMNFIKYFEYRLDTVAYRANLAFSYLEARQKAKQGHFLVNGLPMNRPNYNLNVGDCITPTYDKIQSVEYQLLRLVNRPLQIDQYPSYLLVNERVPVAMIFTNPKLAEIKHTLPISWNFITFSLLHYN